MTKGSKISIASLFCLVFTARIVLANIGVLPAFNTSRQKHLPGSAASFHASNRYEHLAFFTQEKAAGCFSSLEICEEDTDETDKSKSGITVLLLSRLVSFPGACIADKLLQSGLFHYHHPFAFSPRYLTLRVFRV